LLLRAAAAADTGIGVGVTTTVVVGDGFVSAVFADDFAGALKKSLNIAVVVFDDARSVAPRTFSLLTTQLLHCE
jgi:hypothetical protein